MKVLIVSLEDPRQQLGGATQRTAGWSAAAQQLPSVDALRILSLVPNSNGRTVDGRASGQGNPLDVIHAPNGRSLMRRGADRVLATARGLPPHLRVARTVKARQALSRAIEEFQPDIVQLEQLATVHLAAIARGPRLNFASRPAILFSSHNLEHRIVRHTEGFAGALDRRGRRRTAELEERLLGNVDGVVAVTDSEATWFRERTKTPVFLIPNAVDAPHRSALADCEAKSEEKSEAKSEAEGEAERDEHYRHTILFCGHLGYPPNENAAIELLQRVVPQLRSRIPDLRVLLAGRAPRRKLIELVRETSTSVPVELLENPPDSGFLRQASVLVCPLRHGAGSRIKLLEAAASRLPIVCTPFTAEGLALRAGRDFLAGESATDIAEQSARVLTDQALRRSLRNAALATVTEHHNWKRLAPSIGSLYEHLVGHHGEERSHQRT